MDPRSPQAPVAAFFIGSTAVGAVHKGLFFRILKGMQAESANDPTRRRAGFHAHARELGGHGEDQHQHHRTHQQTQHEFSQG